MRLRSKLLLWWGLLVVLLWAGSLWPVQWTIESNFARVASEGFDGTKRSLNALQTEREDRMRQAGRLIMAIPGLRALIAEHNFEVSTENTASLEERLDSLTATIGVNFVCVLDNRGKLIAQNHQSIWTTLPALQDFLHQSPQADSLVHHLFATGATPASAAPADSFGLWVYHGRLFQVVGLPLVFGSGGEGRQEADGALVMATPLTDELARELGSSHHCEVSFLADGAAVASSLPAAQRSELQALAARHAAPSAAFDADMLGIPYRCSLEPLIDPSSNSPVGAMMIQSSLADARAVQAKISNVLLGILISGLLGAAAGSYLLSGVITKPVAALLAGVRRIAGGDLEQGVRVDRRDELGQLATAFNDMVSQLRTRRELQKQVEESQAASRAKSQFLANMSHEIRTPLNGVIGMAELLMATDLSQRQRRYASLAKSSAEVLTVLINDILDFSKIEAGKLEIECNDFSPTMLVEDVVELLAAKAYSKGLDVSCHVSLEVPTRVRGDINRVRQILINLINNAIKFTERGAIAVRVLPEATAAGAPLTLRFCVSDTGIGIPPERMDRMFKSFSQADASTTRKYGGTGLGLAISKQLAELMGGRIGVESEAGRGSTFWFTIAVQADPNALPITLPTGLKGQRVLVAQSNPTTSKLISQWLTELGALPHAMLSGDSLQLLATAAKEGRPFTWAIVGEAGTGLRGLELGAAIRAQPLLQSMQMLLLLRADQECDTQKLHAAGFRASLTLPLRRSHLIDAMLSSKPTTPTAAPHTPATTAPGPVSLTKPGDQAIRILLAEDNEINQLIVTELLALAGYACDVVADGSSAADAALTGNYALVLMDCQMPGMDGFEATRIIRETESAGGREKRRLPIVALTANAISGDRERCLEAGMDAYCTKPIEAKRLLEEIRRLTEKSPPQSSTPAGPSRQTDQSLPLDLAALLENCSGKADIAALVLQKLSEQAQQALAQIRTGAADHDAAHIAKVAHALKGAAGMAAAEPLQKAAARLEEMGRSLNLSEVESAIAQLGDEVRRCRDFVEKTRLASAQKPASTGAR